LITAGPTWVAIDRVRVISNIATGETGILLAKEFLKRGARVTLLLGPAGACCLPENLRVVNFRFFDELRRIARKELRSRAYDIVIHSAAVADFKPRLPARGKLDSSREHNLKLTPLPKIIKEIRQLAPEAKLVMFKLEAGVSDRVLLRRAEKARRKNQAQFAVANRLNPYRAFIIEEGKRIVGVKSKSELVKKLLAQITLSLA
jgi:phosphopantothenoylcysteine decarboxylase/phosphopantothenate--cysteine ligase